MKFFLLLLTVLTLQTATAQENSITVKVKKQTLSLDLEEDNSEKSIVLNSTAKTAKTDKFVIYNSNKAEAKTWKRSFTIYDDADKEIVKFPAPKVGSTQLPLSQVLLKLKKNTGYSLYTIAIPTDPKKAAVVRVRRVLVCKIEVK